MNTTAEKTTAINAAAENTETNNQTQTDTAETVNELTETATENTTWVKLVIASRRMVASKIHDNALTAIDSIKGEMAKEEVQKKFWRCGEALPELRYESKGFIYVQLSSEIVKLADCAKYEFPEDVYREVLKILDCE